MYLWSAMGGQLLIKCCFNTLIQWFWGACSLNAQTYAIRLVTCFHSETLSFDVDD